MVLIPTFPIGATVENSDLIRAFQCGNMGGMRRSKTTNTLVIISDHTKGLYDDKWQGNILNYTGMGKSGDQSLEFMQNKTLYQSGFNGIEVHLFEVLIPGKYIYLGLVDLYAHPYQEVQTGEDGQPRNVWMFPLVLRSNATTIDKEILHKYEVQKARQVTKMSDSAVKQRAEAVLSGKVSVRNVTSSNYIRDPYVSEYAKRRANGCCQLCGKLAPFLNKDKQPYLETHHIDWLSVGGEDTVFNTVALCPNCHRKMHLLNDSAARDLLRQKAKPIVSAF